MLGQYTTFTKSCLSVHEPCLQLPVPVHSGGPITYSHSEPHSQCKLQIVSMTVVLEHEPLDDKVDTGSVVSQVDICLDHVQTSVNSTTFDDVFTLSSTQGTHKRCDSWEHSIDPHQVTVRVCTS